MEKFVEALEWVCLFAIIITTNLYPGCLRSRKNEVGEEILDLLSSFSDFLTFKQIFLDYKAVSWLLAARNDYMCNFTSLCVNFMSFCCTGEGRAFLGFGGPGGQFLAGRQRWGVWKIVTILLNYNSGINTLHLRGKWHIKKEKPSILCFIDLFTDIHGNPVNPVSSHHYDFFFFVKPLHREIDF